MIASGNWRHAVDTQSWRGGVANKGQQGLKRAVGAGGPGAAAGRGGLAPGRGRIWARLLPGCRYAQPRLIAGMPPGLQYG